MASTLSNRIITFLSYCGMITTNKCRLRIFNLFAMILFASAVAALVVDHLYDKEENSQFKSVEMMSMVAESAFIFTGRVLGYYSLDDVCIFPQK